MGFLVCTNNGVRMLSADCTSPAEKLIEMIPQALELIGQTGKDECKRQKIPSVNAAYHEG